MLRGILVLVTDSNKEVKDLVKVYKLTRASGYNNETARKTKSTTDRGVKGTLVINPMAE